MEYRLSQDIVPTHYEMDIKTDIKSKVYDTILKITFKENKNSDKAELHADKSIKINKITQGENEISFTHENGRLVIHHDKLAEAPINIDFTGSLDQPSTAFYYISDNMACTQLEALHARAMYPCFDEPCVKATFRISLTVPKGLTAISNMPAEFSKDEGEFTFHQFQTTPPMCTYLLAIAVGPFVKLAGQTKRGLPVEVYAESGKEEFMSYPLAESIKYIEWYEEYTKVDFPLPRLAIAAVPNFLMGAMENFGLIIARESCSLGHPDKTAYRSYLNAMLTNCHEIAHQWAGNGVSPKWWSSIWLNEGFATIFPYLVFEDLHPEWDFWTIFAQTDASYALDFDAGAATHPIRCDPNSDAEIEGVFDDVCYSKAGAFIRMLREHASHDVFRDALRAYFKTHMYGNADTDDLIAALSAAAPDMGLADFISNWTDQAGFPLVELGDDMVLKQKRFTMNGLVEGQIWDIPLFISLGDVEEKSDKLEVREVHFNTNEMKLEIPEDKFVKLNTGMRAHCRTMLRGKLFEKLLNALEQHKLPKVDAYSALSDAYACARAGVGSFGDVVRVLWAIRGYSDNIVASLAASVSISLAQTFSPIKDAVSEFARPLLRGILDRIGMEPQKDESADTRVLRNSLLNALAFRFGDSDCAEFGRRLFREFRERGDFTVPESFDANLKRFMLMSGAFFEDGGADYVRKAASESADPDTKSHASVSCTFVSSKGMDAALANIMSFNRQDIPWLFAGAAASPDADIRVWEQYKRDHAKLFEMFGLVSFLLPTTISAVVASIDSEKGIEDVVRFFEEHPTEVAKAAIESSVTKVRQRLSIRKEHQGEVLSAIQGLKK